MRLIPWFVSLAITISVIYFYWKPPLSAIRPSSSKTNTELTASLIKAKLIDFRGDEIRWIVNARKADLYEKQKITILQKINGTAVSNKTGRKPTLFKADHGSIKARSNKLIAWGNVEIEFSDGQRLTTQRVIFDQKKEVIYNNTRVFIESNADTIHADSLYYDLKSDLLTLPNPRIQLVIK